MCSIPTSSWGERRHILKLNLAAFPESHKVMLRGSLKSIHLGLNVLPEGEVRPATSAQLKREPA